MILANEVHSGRAPSEDPSSPRETSEQRPLVLVVDDDPDSRATVLELLEEEGYSARGASDGAEALELLAGALPCLILLDLSMPVLNGQEFRERQLRDPRLARIPTVVITAADRPHERTARMGVEAVMAKPFKLEELLAVVERHASGP
jgi:CheY-like chemotaxis protein